MNTLSFWQPCWGLPQGIHVENTELTSTQNEGVQLETNTVTFFCAAKMQFIIATYSAGMSEDDLITCEGNMNLELWL